MEVRSVLILLWLLSFGLNWLMWKRSPETRLTYHALSWRAAVVSLVLVVLIHLAVFGLVGYLFVSFWVHQPIRFVFFEVFLSILFLCCSLSNGYSIWRRRKLKQQATVAN